MESASEFVESRRSSLTDVEGVLVGHFTLPQRPTGCTVITSATPSMSA